MKCKLKEFIIFAEIFGLDIKIQFNKTWLKVQIYEELFQWNYISE